MVEAMTQKAARRGRVVKRAKKSVVFSPPPTFHERYNGTPPRMEKSKVFEKLSAPEASAGRGAFLMEGYYRQAKVVS